MNTIVIKQSTLLNAAKQLILTPTNWTQHYAARDKDNYQVDQYSEAATCFCSTGAIDRVYFNLTGGEIYWNLEFDLTSTLRDIVREKFNQSVIQFNDSHSHEEVLRVFDEAIVVAKELELKAELEFMNTSNSEITPYNQLNIREFESLSVLSNHGKIPFK